MTSTSRTIRLGLQLTPPQRSLLSRANALSRSSRPCPCRCTARKVSGVATGAEPAVARAHAAKAEGTKGGRGVDGQKVKREVRTVSRTSEKADSGKAVRDSSGQENKRSWNGKGKGEKADGGQVQKAQTSPRKAGTTGTGTSSKEKENKKKNKTDTTDDGPAEEEEVPLPTPRPNPLTRFLTTQARTTIDTFRKTIRNRSVTADEAWEAYKTLSTNTTASKYVKHHDIAVLTKVLATGPEKVRRLRRLKAVIQQALEGGVDGWRVDPFIRLSEAHTDMTVETAYEVLATMHNARVKPDTWVMNILLRNIAATKDMGGATRVYERLTREEGVKPDAVTMTTLVDGWAKIGDMAQATRVYRFMVHGPVGPNVGALNALVYGYVKNGDMKTAREFFMDGGIKGTSKVLFTPTVVTLNIIVRGLVDKGEMEEAHRLVDLMRYKETGAIPPNRETMNTLLLGHVMKDDMDRSYVVYKEMQSAGGDMAPDLVTYNTLISGHAKQGDVYRCKRRMDEMKEAGLTPDQTTYASLFNAYMKKSNAKGAASTLSEMESLNHTIPFTTYTTLLSLHTSQGDTFACLALVDKIRTRFRSSLDARTITYLHNQLAKAHLQHADLLGAQQSIREGWAQGGRRDILSYTLMMRACGGLGQPDQVEELLNDMKQRGFIPNKVHYTNLVLGYVRAGKMEKACEVVRRRMKSEGGVEADEAVYKIIVGGWRACGELGVARTW
ncbi:hypothetical protein HK104_003801, partial [Borealophlyctis nickersoniae]